MAYKGMLWSLNCVAQNWQAIFGGLIVGEMFIGGQAVEQHVVIIFISSPA